MKSKTWVITVAIFSMIGILPVAFFNFFIDPLWTFGHAHEWNDVQDVINERQQKTNDMTFNSFNYDTLLLGSSRSTYINQHDFQNMNVYNFSVSNISIHEYESFIEYAKKQNGKDFDRIIIGLDFFKTSIKESSKKHSLDSYIDQATDPFYRFKKLLSLELFDYSMINYEASLGDDIPFVRTYNRSNVANTFPIDTKKMLEATETKIKKFRTTFYGETYQYNEEYKKVLANLKKNNPNTQFIIFTTPISKPLFEAMVDEGRFSDYEKWLWDMVDLFGQVHNFMYINSVTTDLANYFDGHHFYPEVGTLIAHRISQVDNPSLPNDFGVIMTKENFNEHIESLREK